MASSPAKKLPAIVDGKFVEIARSDGNNCSSQVNINEQWRNFLNPRLLPVGPHFVCVSMNENEQRVFQGFLRGNAEKVVKKMTDHVSMSIPRSYEAKNKQSRSFYLASVQKVTWPYLRVHLRSRPFTWKTFRKVVELKSAF